MTRALDLTAEEHHEELEFGPLILPPHDCDDFNDPMPCGICRMRSQMYDHWNKSLREYRMACAADRGEWTPRQERKLEL